MANPARAGALIVGAGLMGRWHAHALRQCNVAVLGVVDVDDGRAARVASRGVPTFGDLSRALEALSPSAVHICTPSETHAELTQLALARGCHALVEKPLALSLPETELLLAQAERADRMLIPVHQFVFQHGVRRLIEAHSLLGPIVHVDVTLASNGAASRGAIGARDPDSVVAEILPHCLSLTTRLLGAPLRDLSWHVTRARAGEWRVSTQVAATSVSYTASMAARPPFAEMRVLGERASALVDLFHGYVAIDHADVSRGSKAARPFRVASRAVVAASANMARRVVRAEPAYPGLNELVRQFHDAARGAGVIPIGADEVRDLASARDVLISLSGLSAAK